MNHLTDLSAEALLAIPPSAPERLFTGAAEQAQREFRALVSVWHPDRSRHGRATEVFQHLNQMYEAALRKLSTGIWQMPGLLTLRAKDGTRYEIRYRREREFELGRLFISPGTVTWLVEKEYADLFENALAVIAGLRFADRRMAEAMQLNMPETAAHFETGDYWVLAVRKAPDMLLLRDVLDHCNGRMDARHVAWIISSLLNLVCYLDYAKLAHNAILAETWFISPEQHSGALLGGWWYAVRQGCRLRAVPAAAVQYAPCDVMARRCGDIRSDLELVRALGRQLLGDITGARLAREKAAPPAMLDWLRLPAAASPVDDYQTWQRRVLPAGFGERRFVKLDLSMTDLY